MIWFILFAVCSVGLLLEKQTSEDRSRLDNPACTSCGYSLVGLTDHGLCPECGDRYTPDQQVRVITRMRRRRGVLGFWLVTLAVGLFFHATTAGRMILGYGVIQSYVADGYRLDVAINATFFQYCGPGPTIVLGLGSSLLGAIPLVGLVAKGWKRYAILAGTLPLLIGVAIIGGRLL